MAKRILIIEDSEDLLELFRLIFEIEGYQVVSSLIGMHASEISMVRADLIIIDIRLHHWPIHGAGICKNFRDRYPLDKTPILLISAERDLEYYARDSRANGYLRKPFELDELLKVCASLTYR